NEIEKLTTVVVVVKSEPYHVIAGSYAIEANATALQKKFSDNGRKSTIEKSRNGNFLVSLNSFATLTAAYNHLITLEDDFDTPIWVYRID
ncbi:MAG: SPOR domain-containing protein, partial [Flavobacteriaceae bacterium]|nr:SPOR domain-containing protein [Flavobacteriaceae bacterium]